MVGAWRAAYEHVTRSKPTIGDTEIAAFKRLLKHHPPREVIMRMARLWGGALSWFELPATPAQFAGASVFDALATVAAAPASPPQRRWLDSSSSRPPPVPGELAEPERWEIPVPPIAFPIPAAQADAQGYQFRIDPDCRRQAQSQFVAAHDRPPSDEELDAAARAGDALREPIFQARLDEVKEHNARVRAEHRARIDAEAAAKAADAARKIPDVVAEIRRVRGKAQQPSASLPRSSVYG